MIHIRTDVISIRVYSDCDSYQSKDKYTAIIQGWALSDSEIFLSSAHGNIGISAIKSIHKKLKTLGFTHVSMMRHGEMHRREL